MISSTEMGTLHQLKLAYLKQGLFLTFSSFRFKPQASRFGSDPPPVSLNIDTIAIYSIIKECIAQTKAFFKKTFRSSLFWSGAKDLIITKIVLVIFQLTKLDRWNGIQIFELKAPRFSMGRYVDYLFNICPFRTMKNCQQRK